MNLIGRRTVDGDDLTIAVFLEDWAVIGLPGKKRLSIDETAVEVADDAVVLVVPRGVKSAPAKVGVKYFSAAERVAEGLGAIGHLPVDGDAGRLLELEI